MDIARFRQSGMILPAPRPEWLRNKTKRGVKMGLRLLRKADLLLARLWASRLGQHPGSHSIGDCDGSFVRAAAALRGRKRRGRTLRIWRASPRPLYRRCDG